MKKYSTREPALPKIIEHMRYILFISGTGLSGSKFSKILTIRKKTYKYRQNNEVIII